MGQQRTAAVADWLKHLGSPLPHHGTTNFVRDSILDRRDVLSSIHHTSAILADHGVQIAIPRSLLPPDISVGSVYLYAALLVCNPASAIPEPFVSTLHCTCLEPPSHSIPDLRPRHENTFAPVIPCTSSSLFALAAKLSLHHPCGVGFGPFRPLGTDQKKKKKRSLLSTNGAPPTIYPNPASRLRRRAAQIRATLAGLKYRASDSVGCLFAFLPAPALFGVPRHAGRSHKGRDPTPRSHW